MKLADFTHGFVLGDGAKGTALQAAGLPLRTCSALWNLERPEAVRAVHAAHVAAGAGWVSTNTFGASRACLANFGLSAPTEWVRKLYEAGVRCAREGAPGLPVLGSIAPTMARTARQWQEA